MSTPWRATRRYSGHNGRCKYGFNCIHFRKNMCTFYHPAEDSVKLAHSIDHYETLMAKGLQRLGLLIEGLGDATAVLAGPKGVRGDDADFGADADATAVPTRVGITAERVLGSFNKTADNKIAVPGCPPLFTPPTQAIQVKPDGDDNPPFPTYTHSLEPLVRAVQCMTPDMDVLGGACDIVANAGSVYRLFNFLVNKSHITMRYDLEWRPTSTPGGGALLMQPWKDDPDHHISYGYGRNFAATTCHFPTDLPAALQASFSHHRVLYYELDGLRFAVHCEADGHYDPQQAAQHPTQHHLPLSPPVSPKLAMSTPASPRSKTKGSRFSVLMEDVDEEEDEKQAPASATLDIDFPCGPAVPVPAAHVVELKTFNSKRLSSWVATGASLGRYVRYRPNSQLYFGRTPQLYEAGHENGMFSPHVRVDSVAARLQKWEANNQEGLQRLVVFLRDLLQRVSAHAAEGHTRLSLMLPGAQDPATADKRARLYVRDDGVAFLPEIL